MRSQNCVSFFVSRAISLTLCFAVCCAVASEVRSESKKPSLVRAMDQVADKVVSVLDELERTKHVSVGDFTARGRSKSSGGIEIRRQLAECLRGKGLIVSDDQGDEYTFLAGWFKIIESPAGEDDFDSLGIELTVEFYDENSDMLKMNNMKVEGGPPNEVAVGIEVFGEDVTALTGVTYEVKPNDSPKEKQKKIIQQYHNPTVETLGSKVGASDLYRVEILVSQNGKLVPRELSTVNGNAFVQLEQGEEYAVKVHNDADHPINVGLSIDGVNTFIDAQDIKPEYGRRIAREHSSAVFRGWYIHSGKKEVLGPHHKPLPAAKAFLISGYDDSVANREGLGPSSISMGMITVDVRASWPKNGQPLADEPSSMSAGTAQGKAVDTTDTIVTDLAHSQHTRAVIHVRYNK